MGLFWLLAMSMLYHVLFYSVYTVKVTNSFPSVQPVLCHEDESSALLQFKQNFVIKKFASENFPSHPKTVSWIPKTDCCSWDGVECDDQTGHVIDLDLSSSQLYGSIASNSSLFHLSQLQRLNLSYNHFNYSQIPSSLSHLSRLTHLDLSYSMFSGEIPKEISQLSKLLILNLCCNYVSSFPEINLLQLKHRNFISFIQNLTNIQRFSLSFVDISSPIPSILTNLSTLQLLDLHSTGVYGEFPIGLFRLPNLEVLNVRSNQDLTGYLPASIGNLTSLKALLLSQCRFSGSIPSSLGNLTQLQYLELSVNKFQGEIPHSTFSLDNLAYLDLAVNLLEGQMELNLFSNLKRLKYLYLSHNNLSLLTKISSSDASLPRNIRQLGLAACNINEFPKLLKYQNQLEVLDLSQNKMHGTLPSWMWRKKYLWALLLSNNLLIGEISPLICNLKSLEFVDLSFNNISGTIPPCLGTFDQNLQTLKPKNNKFHGFIPQTIMKASVLKMIDFSQNNLQGQLPKALANSRMLEYLDVSNNQINDSFPLWLGALPQLKVLILRSNKFSGGISSPRNSTFRKIHIIDLSQNDFSGKFPLELMWNWDSMRASNMNDIKYEAFYHYFNYMGIIDSENYHYSLTIFNKGNLRDYEKLQEFYFLIAIDLSSNKLGGEIPAAIGDLKGLISLNLSNNLFTGGISSSLGKLSKLEALDLSHNSLTGRFPQELAQLTFLEFLNVSYNNLSGPIPQSTQLDTFEGSSFEGNEGLCGKQLLKKCEDDAAPTSAVDEDSWFPFEFDWKIIVIGYGGGLVFGIAMGSTYNWEKHALLWLIRVHRRVKRRY